MASKKIVETIGNTPLVELAYFSTPHVKILAKLEGNNPCGSIKDRVAYYLITQAQKKNLLTHDKTILEATSGNTGIALAMLSSVLGYKFTAVMPESVSMERRKLLKAFGADIILTDGPKGTNFAIATAHEMAKENPQYYMLDQFANTANVLAHYETTGEEIIKDAPHITHFVAGMGTGGTLMGAGKKLKEYNKNIQIIGVEPMPFSKIQGLRNMTDYVPPIYNEAQLDHKLLMTEDAPAFELARELFKKEGISVGMSAGAALWGALKVRDSIKQGTIVTVFPDRGDRYASTALFDL